jgi:hypothetical protein
VVLPGSVLVVEGAGLEAAVEDADEPVGELAQGGVVADVPAAQRVVIGAGARGGAERGEGLQVQRGTKAAVGGPAGQDHGFLAGRPGDRALPGVVLAAPGVSEPAGVVAELAENAGGQDDPETRLAEIDISGRVPAKMPVTTAA